MKHKSLQRTLLLATGLCAVIVILLSQSFYQTGTISYKIKTEKTPDAKEVVIHAPSDVAVQGQVVELDNSQPFVAEELILADDKNEKTDFIQKVVTNLFKTLFRVIISPNAP